MTPPTNENKELTVRQRIVNCFSGIEITPSINTVDNLERLMNQRVIEELESPRTYHIDEGYSSDFHDGFAHALDQVTAADNARIAQLKDIKETT